MRNSLVVQRVPQRPLSTLIEVCVCVEQPIVNLPLMPRKPGFFDKKKVDKHNRKVRMLFSGR